MTNLQNTQSTLPGGMNVQAKAIFDSLVKTWTQ